MTRGPARNIAASVRQRLMNVARSAGRPFSEVLLHYAMERFLLRLSRSRFERRFVLKGALMLAAWQSPRSRPTRDIDLLGHTSNNVPDIEGIFREICRQDVPADGMEFDASSVSAVAIKEDADYQGVRVRFSGRLETARVAMQVDVGFGDVIRPKAIRITYPTLLGQPAPTLNAYSRESAIAEKLEAMIKLAQLNSRMKDFYDIWLLSAHFAFDGKVLADAVQATFHNRGTDLPAHPTCFSPDFRQDATKTTQWAAFRRKSRLTDAPEDFAEVVDKVAAFLVPVIQASAGGAAFARDWAPGGPWR